VELVGASADIRVVNGRGYWTGLETCGDANACPVCAGKIRSRKAEDLRDGISRWLDRASSVSLLTLTVPHDVGDRLGLLLRAESEGWHKIVSGAPYQRLKKRLGITGTVVTTEVTHGYNGWHPHKHVLIFHDRPWTGPDLAAFEQYAYERWRRACVARGLREPDRDHGVDLRINCDTVQVGSYVAKLQEGDWSVADEITRSDVKTGRSAHRTPFELLRDYYSTGDRADWDLWAEYVSAIKGTPVCRWSRGLRALIFGPDAIPEKTDAELALEDVGGDLVARCPPQVFARVRAAGLQLLACYAAESGGLPAVNALLAEYGCGWALPPIREGPAP
jgi:hypothetical protein